MINAATKNIDEVLRQLGTIIYHAEENADPIGLFAALYYKVTERVKVGIQSGRFEDGDRMEVLDVLFANRFLEAYVQYQAGEPCTQSWQVAFDAAKRKNLILLQHLFMGINAHINLDLGIVTAQAAPGEQLVKIERDFLEINVLLAEMIDEVQNKIRIVSPLVGFVDLLSNKDEQFAQFSLNAARKHAWTVAELLSTLSGQRHAAAIANIDAYVVKLNDLVVKPGTFKQFLFRIIGLFEEKNIPILIQVLQT